MKNVALHNLGCKVNSYEIEVMQQKLQEKGYKIVPFDEKADIYIINTCTVTNIADRKSRQMLHRAKKQNPDAVVVAVGCYVQTGKEQVEKDECIDLAIGNHKKSELVTLLEEFLQRRQEEKNDKTLEGATIMDLSGPKAYEEMTLSQTAEHTRAYIKIQDGCNQFCSYCIIPFARGRVCSRTTEEILTEIGGLCEKGYREFVLTGIHISSYGTDLKGENYNTSEMRGDGLLELIKKICTLTEVKRLRLGSLEPSSVTERFASELSSLPQVCPHFHLSLQSGCDETLKRMNRRYTTEEFEQSVRLLRQYFVNPAITTDVITGFPGETKEEFAKTQAFLEKIRFFEMHVFPYSRREGTVAASMKGQLTEAVKKERSRALIEMESRQSLQYRQQFLGHKEEILLEEEKIIDGKCYMIGHTARYVKAAVEQREDGRYHSNQFVTGIVRGMLGTEVLVIDG
ncbi:MAG: tRNA (N(6)-L-threonylcarbamoyladenosine(37)-C(2))-methylthiotransferase MtaB [Lachnospiraceae bacterium]|nr:tRNA (N(6)-L-threonylcarbamoyladenosine(37)-C(2))-methylthiotransferase MtaB [Lachnospiraceae bacterium]